MTGRPDRLTDRPKDGLLIMDALTGLLSALRLTGGIFVDARFTSPFAVRTCIEPSDVADFIPGAREVIGYHVVTEGALDLVMPETAPVRIEAGEVVILPRGEAHVLTTDPALAPVEAKTLIRRGPGGALLRIDHGGGGAETHVYCGFLGAPGGFNPLFAGLPQVLKVDARELAARDWIEASVRFAAEGLAGGSLPATDIVSRLSESLLIEGLRRHLEAAPDDTTGWAGAARDPQIGRALSRIHRDPGAPHSVESLADTAAMSRSAFVQRFGALLGLPPMRYLTLLRLDLGQRRLIDTPDPIAAIAWDLGYHSEEAFSRAFRREFGTPPGRWREARRRAA
jgi:AraC-like DNA-binding protein